MVKVFLIFVLFLYSASVFAGNYCDVDTALASYKAAVKRKNIGDHEGAFGPFMSLAELGMAPAQRQLAEYYLEESRAENALEQGAMWAQLSAWGGDREGQEIVKRLASTLRDATGNKALVLAKEWLPVKPLCGVAPNVEQDDVDLKMAGRFPLYRGDNVEGDVFNNFTIKISQALKNIDKVAPQLSPLVDLIPAFEVVAGVGSDRFMSWDETSGRLLISSSYLNDLSERQLAYALVLSVQRAIYSKIKRAVFLDPIALNVGNFSLYGSLYGDAKTQRFLSLFQKALLLSYKLPVVLHDMVYSLNEIHYMPGSRYHKSRLSTSKEFAEYDYKRSTPSRRMAIVFKRLNFETTEEILLQLVRLGYYAQQHALIEGYRNDTEGKSKEEMILKALEGNGMSAAALFNQGTASKKDLVEAWDKDGPAKDKKIACAAVYAQVKAAMTLKIQGSIVSRSVKLQPCTKARVAWNKYRSRKNEK